MKLLSIIRKDLRILVRNRPEMAVLFLMPLAFILPISFALGAGDGYGINRSNRMISLPIVNYDGGPRAQDLMAVVGESLLLETNFESDRLRALGLEEEEDCGPVFDIVKGSQDDQAAAEPEQADSGTLSQDPGYPPVQKGEEVFIPIAENDSGYPPVQESEEVFIPIAENNTGYPPAGTEVGETEPSPTNAPDPDPDAGADTDAEEGEEGDQIVRGSPACNEKAARALLQRSARTAALIIPAGFSQAVDSGSQTQVEVIFDPAGDSIQLQQIEGIIRGAAVKISLENQVGRGLDQLNDLVVLAPDSVRQSWQEQSAQPLADGQDPALSLKKASPEDARAFNTPDTYQQTVPGYAVMYVFFIITALTGSIREEKRNGTFRRLLSAPVGRSELAAGKLLAAMLVGFVQVVFLFIIGAVVFKLGLGRDPLAFLVLTGALVAAAAALGLAAATTPLKGAGLAAPLIIAALLGGCMFPIDLMPPFLRGLSYAMPHSWALNGYLNLMVRGYGLQEIIPQVGALLGFALVFFLIAVWRFRFDD